MKTYLFLFIACFTCSFLHAQQTADLEQYKVEEVFKVVDEMPRFPDQGCEDLPTVKKKKKCADKKLMEFIENNIQYPNNAKIAGAEGFAVVSFIVNTDGSINDTKILYNPGWGMGTEALRVVNLMVEQNIHWIPGKQRDNYVKVAFNLPVQFKLKKK